MFGQQKALKYLIYYVTSRCNLRCLHCFYTEELCSREDLSLSEIRRLARGLYPLVFLRVTGGEPFLRSDLPEVIEAFVNEAGVHRMGMITNGTLTDAIEAKVKDIFLRCPSLSLDLGVSVDGLSETHDRLRNRAGVYEQCRATVERLVRVREHQPGLQVSIVVTVSSGNVQELGDLLDELSTWDADRISPNLVRGRTADSSVARVSFAEYEDFALKCEAYHHARSRDIRSAVQRAKNILTREAIRKILTENHSPIACAAASRIGVLYSDGTVSICEPLFHERSGDSTEKGIDPVLGNVREVDYDFRTLWESEAAEKARRWIRNTHCRCTHECFLTASILWDRRRYPRLLMESLKDMLFR
ncbi:MAG TPA: radical SAM protein [bacterium]|nr:radical SAM protein [bacterium]HQL61740.1 radical SAM protein [bacterium]